MGSAKKKEAPVPTAAHVDPIPPPAPIITAAPGDTIQVTRPGMVLLARAQFINTVEIPALNNRTLWIDLANKTFAGIDFLWDQAGGFVRLEKPGDKTWRTVMVPVSNVAAIFPAEG